MFEIDIQVMSTYAGGAANTAAIDSPHTPPATTAHARLSHGITVSERSPDTDKPMRLRRRESSRDPAFHLARGRSHREGRPRIARWERRALAETSQQLEWIRLRA